MNPIDPHGGEAESNASCGFFLAGPEARPSARAHSTGRARSDAKLGRLDRGCAGEARTCYSDR